MDNSINSPNPLTTDEVTEEVVAKPKHNNWLESWRKLKKNQKGALITAVFMAVFLPIIALAVRNEQLTSGRAADPATPPITPPGPPSDFGQAIELDGEDDYVYVTRATDRNTISLKKGFTAEAWFKLNEFDNLEDTQLIGTAVLDENTGALPLQMYLRPDYMAATDEYALKIILVLEHKSSPNGCFASPEIEEEVIYPASQLEELADWHHLAVVIQNSGEVNLFFDGQKMISTFTLNEPCTKSAALTIGSRLSFDNPPIPYAHSFFPGQIDDVRISKISRYLNNFSLSGPFSPDSDTMALYNMNGDANDSSGNSRHGVIYGDPGFVVSTIPSPSPIPTSTPAPSNRPSPSPKPSPSPRP